MPRTFLSSNDDYGPLAGAAVAVTASDVTVYDPPLRGLYLNGAGTVAIEFADLTTFSGSPATGVFHPLAGIRRVLATGTTATGIYGFRS